MRRCIQANKAVMNGLICAMRKAPPSLSAIQLQSPLCSGLCKYGPPLAVLTGNCLKVTPSDQAATARRWMVHQHRLTVSPSAEGGDFIPLKNMIKTTSIYRPPCIPFTVSPAHKSNTHVAENIYNPCPLVGRLEQEA